MRLKRENTNREALFKENRLVDHEKDSTTYLHQYKRYC